VVGRKHCDVMRGGATRLSPPCRPPLHPPCRWRSAAGSWATSAPARPSCPQRSRRPPLHGTLWWPLPCSTARPPVQLPRAARPPASLPWLTRRTGEGTASAMHAACLSAEASLAGALTAAPCFEHRLNVSSLMERRTTGCASVTGGLCELHVTPGMHDTWGSYAGAASHLSGPLPPFIYTCHT
jgi:hypothetical protein